MFVKKPLSLGADELIPAGKTPPLSAATAGRQLMPWQQPLKRSANSTSFSAAVRQLTRIPVRSVPVLPKILGLPQVTVAKKSKRLTGKVKVDKVTTDGYEVVEVPTTGINYRQQ